MINRLEINGPIYRLSVAEKNTYVHIFNYKLDFITDKSDICAKKELVYNASFM